MTILLIRSDHSKFQKEETVISYIKEPSRCLTTPQAVLYLQYDSRFNEAGVPDILEMKQKNRERSRPIPILSPGAHALFKTDFKTRPRSYLTSNTVFFSNTPNANPSLRNLGIRSYASNLVRSSSSFTVISSSYPYGVATVIRSPGMSAPMISE